MTSAARRRLRPVARSPRGRAANYLAAPGCPAARVVSGSVEDAPFVLL